LSVIGTGLIGSLSGDPNAGDETANAIAITAFNAPEYN
jgi:hypothetical protein